jgi:hypothetical protein
MILIDEMRALQPWHSLALIHRVMVGVVLPDPRLKRLHQTLVLEHAWTVRLSLLYHLLEVQ